MLLYVQYVLSMITTIRDIETSCKLVSLESQLNVRVTNTTNNESDGGYIMQAPLKAKSDFSFVLSFLSSRPLEAHSLF